MRIPFLDYLKDHIVLFDGAMGSEIYKRGQFINICYDSLNLSNPKLILEIHEAYIQAGADILETNTFVANRDKLKKYGLEDQVRDINLAGARIAREAAGEDKYVAGSIGQPGAMLHPRGPLTNTLLQDIVLEQAQALVENDIDVFLLETYNDVQILTLTVKILKEKFDLPIIAQMTISVDGYDIYGSSPETLTQKLQDSGADIVGLNCTVGPKTMLEAIEKMVPATECPISVMPNAGLPQNVDGRNIYLASPEYFGEYTRHFINAGAKVIGGCCGTSPEFTKSMRKAISSLQPKTKIEALGKRQKAKGEIKVEGKVEDESKNKIKSRDKSEFARALADGEFVSTVEIVPPRGSDATKAIEQAKILKDAGVNAVNIPDGPRALSRMGAQYLSLMIKNESGMEIIQHNACRDRNLLGMVGDLLGADAMGIRNILIITGDPPKMGSFPDATAVFDVDAIGLTSVVHSLNQGIDLGGNQIPAPTRFFPGVGVNPGAIDMERELRRFQEKIDAGAEYAISQPVFDMKIFEAFLEKINPCPIPIIAGIWPLVSLRNAEFMNNEVPGASVPKDIMERLRSAASKEEAREIGLQIASETIKILKNTIAGVQVSMPFGKVKYPLQVLKDTL